MRKLPTIRIKGKDYVMVKDRIVAFREDHPDWTIDTDIVYIEEGMVVTKTKILDETGRLISSGLAYEREGSTNITATSFVEVAETSSAGRALGMLGYGIDDSLGSADEIANAMLQQEAMGELATDAEKAAFRAMCGKAGIDPKDVLKAIGWKSGLMTKAQHGKALVWMKERGMI